MKEVRDRIASVKNTQKITEAMKLVAAAKVRRAQEAVVNARPFSENLVKVRIVAALAPASEMRGLVHCLGQNCPDRSPALKLQQDYIKVVLSQRAENTARLQSYWQYIQNNVG